MVLEDKVRAHVLNALVLDEASIVAELCMVAAPRCHWPRMPHAFSLVGIDPGQHTRTLAPRRLPITGGIVGVGPSTWSGLGGAPLRRWI